MRQLVPAMVYQLARLAHAKDGKLAYLAATALLDRGYGLPVSGSEVEGKIAHEKGKTEHEVETAQYKAAVEDETQTEQKARSLLEARWEELSPEQRVAQLKILVEQREEWKARDAWVKFHLGGVNHESLASGATILACSMFATDRGSEGRPVTVTPDTTRKLATLHEAQGSVCVEAPIFGVPVQRLRVS